LNSQYLTNKYDNWPQWINIQMSFYDSKSIETSLQSKMSEWRANLKTINIYPI
jgi:hypothetical protein